MSGKHRNCETDKSTVMTQTDDRLNMHCWSSDVNVLPALWKYYYTSALSERERHTCRIRELKLCEAFYAEMSLDVWIMKMRRKWESLGVVALTCLPWVQAQMIPSLSLCKRKSTLVGICCSSWTDRIQSNESPSRILLPGVWEKMQLKLNLKFELNLNDPVWKILHWTVFGISSACY